MHDLISIIDYYLWIFFYNIEYFIWNIFIFVKLSLFFEYYKYVNIFWVIFSTNFLNSIILFILNLFVFWLLFYIVWCLFSKKNKNENYKNYLIHYSNFHPLFWLISFFFLGYYLKFNFKHFILKLFIQILIFVLNITFFMLSLFFWLWINFIDDNMIIFFNILYFVFFLIFTYFYFKLKKK